MSSTSSLSYAEQKNLIGSNSDQSETKNWPTLFVESLDQLDFPIGSRAEDFDDLRLICSSTLWEKTFLGGYLWKFLEAERTLKYLGGLFQIVHILLDVGFEKCQTQLFEVSAEIILQVVGKKSSVELLVHSADGLQLSVGSLADDGDYEFFVGSQTFHRFVQSHGVRFCIEVFEVYDGWYWLKPNTMDNQMKYRGNPGSSKDVDKELKGWIHLHL